MGTTTADSATTSTDTSHDVAAQARAIHLTGGQTAALNAEVERIQAEMGGRRVNLNTISLGDRNSVHVAVPGEATPRDLGVTGSWDNNQTTGTRARMYDGKGSLGCTTPRAHSCDDVAS